jgi:trehalose 6-phosphate synthase
LSRLVAVSNRVSIPRKSAAPGGLAVGLLAAMKSRGGLWFGWSGELTDEDPPDTDIVRRAGATFATTDMRRDLFEPYYFGFANGVLWPLCHYFLETFRYRDEHYEAYLNANRFFADRLERLLDPGDVVWVHDYHLIPLARLLRERGTQLPFGFFLHTPFPHYEVLRALPVYAELLRDLCCYDLVGFQTANDLNSFLDSIQYVWGREAVAERGFVHVDGRRVRAGVFPIGVDVQTIEAESEASLRAEAVKRLARSVGERKLVMGVDRLDYSKGLVERFEAFNRFLQEHPELHGKVTLMQIAPLSRADMRAYEVIRQQLEGLAGRINGEFAETDWTPLRYLNRNFSHELLMGYMRISDACLVTPVRDGMNLVAKEFVAAQDPANPGVLILSTLAGAARELTNALQINPYDRRGVAQAIDAALTMPLSERRRRHEALIDTVRRNDIHAWHRTFMEELESSAGQSVLDVPGGAVGGGRP